MKNSFSQQASDLLYMQNTLTFLSSMFKMLSVSVVIVICSHAEMSKFLIAIFSTPGALEYSVLEVRRDQQYRK